MALDCGRIDPEASRDLPAIFREDMCVLHGRLCIAVTEPILPHCHGNIFNVHHTFIPMSEGMEAAPLNSQLLKQWIQPPFPHHVSIPRREVFADEEQIESFSDALEIGPQWQNYFSRASGLVLPVLVSRV